MERVVKRFLLHNNRENEDIRESDFDELKQDELPSSHVTRMNSPTFLDNVHRFYLTRLRGMRDFKYMTRAIKPTSELLVVGQLNFKNN